MPAAIDRDGSLAARVRATITPQAVVVDRRGEVRYRGRIDNFYAALGRPRQVVTAHDLHDALTALAGGKPVAHPETDPIGCYIVPCELAEDIHDCASRRRPHRSGAGLVRAPRGRGHASAAAGPVTFSETVAPILYENCVTCHRPGQAAPFSLISYDDAKKKGKLIAKVTESRYMPPWHAAHGYGEFAGERRLTDAQIATLAEWVKQGMPQGDPGKMPALPKFPGGLAPRHAGSRAEDARRLRAAGQRSRHLSQLRDPGEA